MHFREARFHSKTKQEGQRRPFQTDRDRIQYSSAFHRLAGVTQIVRADIDWKGIYWEPYVFVGAIFFVMCYGMSRYSMYLERKLRTDHR